MANTYESPEGRNSASLIFFVPSIQCDAFPQEPGRMRDTLLQHFLGAFPQCRVVNYSTLSPRRIGGYLAASHSTPPIPPGVSSAGNHSKGFTFRNGKVKLSSKTS